LSELAAGRLTVAHVKKGLPATRTLAGEGKSPASVPEEGKAIDLLDDILHELLSDTSPNSLDALSIDTLDRISAYLDEPLP
jgi:hypothetical protein